MNRSLEHLDYDMHPFIVYDSPNIQLYLTLYGSSSNSATVYTILTPNFPTCPPIVCCYDIFSISFQLSTLIKTTSLMTTEHTEILPNSPEQRWNTVLHPKWSPKRLLCSATGLVWTVWFLRTEVCRLLLSDPLLTLSQLGRRPNSNWVRTCVLVYYRRFWPLFETSSYQSWVVLMRRKCNSARMCYGFVSFPSTKRIVDAVTFIYDRSSRCSEGNIVRLFLLHLRMRYGK